MSSRPNSHGVADVEFFPEAFKVGTLFDLFMFREAYYVHVHGEQKGPYTFVELKRLYERSFFPEETLFWQDGMEQWLPVAELCGPTLRERKRQSRARMIVYGIAALAVVAILAFIAPTVVEGWREAAPRADFTDVAAYWKARDFVRSELRKQNTNVDFEEGKIALDAINRTAAVTLPCTVFRSGARGRHTVWRASMRFDPAQHQWSGVAADEVAATK